MIIRTGYESSLEAYKKIFDPDLISQTPYLWGFDDEMEVRGVWRATSHPAVCCSQLSHFLCSHLHSFVKLWYAGGDFGICRTGSKNLVSSRRRHS